MSPSAVLIGRTVSDVISKVTSLIVMAAMGLIVGWRIHTPPQEAILGFLVLLAVFIPLGTWRYKKAVSR